MGGIGLQQPSDARVASWGPVADAIIARTSTGQWDRFAELAAHTGYCTNPVRITGSQWRIDTATGEATQTYTTATEPEGTLLIACRNRRASICPSCSAMYSADTWHLVAAGLIGGKGIPATVASHPRVFVTATAPGYGQVHRSDNTGHCHPDTTGPMRCTHGRATTCTAMHDPTDPRLGAALCPDCFDYAGVVLFNAHAPALWHRTTQEVLRRLAAATGTTIRATHNTVRLSFTKVAEHQARGAVHIHGVARLDTNTPGRTLPPPAPYNNPALLAAAFTAALNRTTTANLAATAETAQRLPVAGEDATLDRIGWGPQSVVAIVTGTTSQPDHELTDTEPEAEDRSVLAVANYLAKYVTKTLPATTTPEPATRNTSQLTRAEHWQRLARACHDLAAQPELASLRLGERTEGVGYPSRPVSRSRTYSTTLAALRAARQRHATGHPKPDDDGTVQVGEFRYTGKGWANPADAAWAHHQATAKTAARDAAREQRRAEP